MGFGSVISSQDIHLEHGDGLSQKGHTQPGKVRQNPRYRAKLSLKTSFSPKWVISINDSHLWQSLTRRIFPKSKIIYLWQSGKPKAKHPKWNLEGSFP
jgi:hypothetical protein